MGHDFNESFACRDNFLTRFDPRVKLVVILVALGGIITTRHLLLPLVITLGLLALLLYLRVNRNFLLLRLGLPLALALVIFLTQIFLYGSTPLLAWQVGPWVVTLYREGISHGLLLALRVLAGISLLLFLTLTTTMDKLLFALRWIKVPQPLMEMMTVAYRYVYIFREELVRVRKAQRIRLGYRDWQKGLQAAASLGGIILLRAFDKSEKLYRSMLGRGYRGGFEVTSQGEVAPEKDLSSLAVGLLLVLLTVLAV